jgi:hypothetical protein
MNNSLFRKEVKMQLQPKLKARPTLLKLNLPGFLSNVNLTDRKALLACFSIGFLIRLIPELLAFPLPIGFDTIYYATAMKSGVILAHWSKFFTSSWLLYAFIVPLYNFLQADPFLLLKIVAPLLFGLNVAGVYWFSRKMLGWSLRVGVLTGLFFALQLASLRISWDLLRNTLGLGILLFALSYVKEVNSKRGFVLFASLALLSVFAHEYAAVTLLVVVLGLLVWRLIKRKLNSGSIRLGLATLPALTVFLIGMGLRFFPISYATETNVIKAVGDAVPARVGGLPFLVDYLHIQSSVDSYASYFNLALSVGLLFTVLFLPYIFLVVKGFFRNGVLNLWIGLLLIGAFGCLIVPFAALQYWHRWMFMLVYPFTFYAVNGFGRLLSKFREKNMQFSSWFSDRKAATMVLVTFSLGVAYLATPVLMVYTNASVPVVTGTYLYFSTSPTVPYQDVNSVIEAMDWLNNKLNAASCVALQHAFLSWGQLYLDKSHEIVHFVTDVDAALNTGFQNGFSSVFFVWWNEPIGWYGISVPASFVRVQDFGRISVYVYEGINVVGS